MRESDLAAYKMVERIAAWKQERAGVDPSLNEIRQRFPDKDAEQLLYVYQALQYAVA